MQHRRFAMKSSALFTAFVLGAAATVSAQPKREAAPKQEENGERVRLDDKKSAKTVDTVASAADWIELASPTPAKHGTEFVMVGKRAGSFTRLRLDAAKGKTIVRTVKIYFDDAKPKTVQVDTILSGSSQVDVHRARRSENYRSHRRQHRNAHERRVRHLWHVRRQRRQHALKFSIYWARCPSNEALLLSTCPCSMR